MTKNRAAVLSGLLAFLGCFAVTIGFALLTPLSASPDEPDHWRQAYAVWSGQTNLVGAPDLDDPAMSGTYAVPRYMVGYLARCTYQQPLITADCVPEPAGSELVTDYASTAGYPPTFYLATGWVTKIAEGSTALYGLRLASGAFFSTIVALTVGLLRQARSGWRPHMALLLGLTPSVCFLAGTTNPSSLEVASMALLVVVQWRWFQASMNPNHWYWYAGLLAVGVYAATVRPLSALLAGVTIFATSVAFLPRAQWRRYSWKIVILLLVALLALVRRVFGQVGSFSDIGGGTTPESYLTPVTAVWSSLWKGLSLPESWVSQMGWLDTGNNAISTVAWFAAIGLAVLAGLSRSGRRRVLAAEFVIVILLILWLYLDSVYTRSVGVPFWQARYGAPLVIVALLLVGLGHAPTARRLQVSRRTVLATSLILIAFAASAAVMLIRYGWGPDWQGPLGAPIWVPFGNVGVTALLLVLLTAGVLILCLGPLFVREHSGRTRRRGGGTPDGDRERWQTDPQLEEGVAANDASVPHSGQLTAMSLNRGPVRGLPT